MDRLQQQIESAFRDTRLLEKVICACVLELLLQYVEEERVSSYWLLPSGCLAVIIPFHSEVVDCPLVENELCVREPERNPVLFIHFPI